MKIAILGGCGAMGGLFGGYLAAGGDDVVLVDVSSRAVDAINSAGLAIEERDGSVRTIPVKATTDPQSVGPVDFVINFVKCYHTEAAIRSALPMIGEQTTVLSLQNGWGNAQRIAAIVGEPSVMVGLTYHSSVLVEPGRVRHPADGMTFVGELDGRESERLAAIAASFRRANIAVTVSPAIVDEVWKKLSLNASTLAVAALLRLRADQFRLHGGAMALAQGLLDEVVAVATKQKIAIDRSERWDTISGILQRAVGGKGSMLQDVEASRRTEIDVINGAIAEAGRRVGVATPLNDAMVWLVTSMQEAYLAEASS